MATTDIVQHTPGPWHTTQSYDGSWSIWDRLDDEGYGYDWLAGVNSEANARLIAAAPTMLEALTEILRHVHEEPVSEQHIDTIARAAISAARGQQ